MTWEQLSLFTDEELGLQGPKKIEKTVAIQLQELREQIAREIEAKTLPKRSMDKGRAGWNNAIEVAVAIARGEK
jgi:hypothetical protein